MLSIYDIVERVLGVPMRGVMKPIQPYISKRWGPRKPPQPGLNRSRKLEGKPGYYDGRPIVSRYQ